MTAGLSAEARAKAWLHERIEELPDRHADQVWEIWQTEAEDDLRTQFEGGESIPSWVFAVRNVMLKRRSSE